MEEEKTNDDTLSETIEGNFARDFANCMTKILTEAVTNGLEDKITTEKVENQVVAEEEQGTLITPRDNNTGNIDSTKKKKRKKKKKKKAKLDPWVSLSEELKVTYGDSEMDTSPSVKKDTEDSLKKNIMKYDYKKKIEQLKESRQTGHDPRVITPSASKMTEFINGMTDQNGERIDFFQNLSKFIGSIAPSDKSKKDILNNMKKQVTDICPVVSGDDFNAIANEIAQ